MRGSGDGAGQRGNRAGMSGKQWLSLKRLAWALRPWQFYLHWMAFSHKEDNKQKKWNGRLRSQDGVGSSHSQLALANVANLKPLHANM